MCIFTTVQEQGVNCMSKAPPLPTPHATSKGNCTSLWWSLGGLQMVPVDTKTAFVWVVPCKDSRDFFKIDIPCGITPAIRHPPCALWDRPTVSSTCHHFSCTSVGTRPSCSSTNFRNIFCKQCLLANLKVNCSFGWGTVC